MDLDGKPVATWPCSGKLYALDFWASWCAPARLQLAALDSLQSDYAGRVQVVAVDLDSDRAALDAFLATHDPEVLITVDPPQELISSLELRAIPTDFVVDTKGIIHFVSVGYRRGLPELRAKIDSLLVSPAGHGPLASEVNR